MKLILKNITKTFDDVKVLDNFSAAFDEGVNGILGMNGSGKSVIMRLIMGHIDPDLGMGEILLNGKDIRKTEEDINRIVGYVPQQQNYYDRFSPRAYLKYMAAVKELSSEQAERQTGTLLESMGLTDVQYQKIGRLSGSIRQKVWLAQALLGNPDVILLDAPFENLMPFEYDEFKEMIQKISNDKIVLVTAHSVCNLEGLARKLVIMENGKCMAEGTPKELIRSLQGKVAEIACKYEDITYLQRNYRVGNLTRTDTGLTLRLVGEHFPKGAYPVTDGICLDDVCLYYLGKEGNGYR